MAAIAQIPRHIREVTNARSALDFVFHWGAILLIFALAHAANHVLVYLLSAIVIAALQNALGSLTHEAWHGKCFRPRWLDQWVGTWLYAYPIGLAHCEGDERIPIDHFWRLRDAATPDPQLTVYAGCGHTEGYENYPGQYVAEVVSYFNTRLGE